MLDARVSYKQESGDRRRAAFFYFWGTLEMNCARGDPASATGGFHSTAG